MQFYILTYSFIKYILIVLIHPIQWTIANSVSADRPAKQQKKVILFSHRLAGHTVYSPDGASYFLSRCRNIKKYVSLAKVAKPSTDNKLEAMDQKRLECFSRLEAMLLSKSFNQPEPVFQSVVVSPAKPPPAGAVDNTQPFFEPQPTDRPTTTHRAKSDNRPVVTDQPTTDQVSKQASSTSTVEVNQPGSDSDMDASSDSDSDSVVPPHFTGQAEEGELSDLDQDVSVTDQTASEEQNYRETMHGIHSYMGWTHVPDMDSAASSAEDNPIERPKQQTSRQD